MEEDKKEDQISTIKKIGKIMSAAFIMIFIFNALISLITYHPLVLTIATFIASTIAFACFLYLVKINYTNKSVAENTQIYFILKMFVWAYIATIIFPATRFIFTNTDATAGESIILLLVLVGISVFLSLMLTILIDSIVGHILCRKQIIKTRNIAKMVISLIFFIVGIVVVIYSIPFVQAMLNTDGGDALGSILGGSILILVSILIMLLDLLFYSISMLIIKLVQKSKMQTIEKANQ